MKDRLHLYHALDQLRLPDKSGKPPSFSIEFIVANDEKKGQLRFIESAVVNHFSKGKTKEAMEKAKEMVISAQSVSKRQVYNHKEAGVLGIRVLHSERYKSGTVLTPKKIFITRINGLKTFI
jgi:hypothetical protein